MAWHSIAEPRANERKPILRTAILFILVLHSISHSDVLRSMGKFWFINPGITLTKEGAGFELSGGRSGMETGEPAFLGTLVRYEPAVHRAEVAMEAGVAIFLLEAGFSLSDQGSGVFFAPDLSIPIPASKDRWMVMNLYYRIYPVIEGASTVGASLKFAWMR
jgi:hypothetical protein